MILGAVIAVIVTSPGKNPPVLRPAGLTADSAGLSAVAFRWSGPASGPVPDRYEILRNGRRAGYVPGSITFYRDTGLAPASSYAFQVIAIRDGRLSARSAVLTVATVTPPVSAAVLAGTWYAQYKLTSVVNFSWIKARSWTETWKFTPACGAGTCAVLLSSGGSGNENAFTVSLARSGSVFTGSVPVRNFAYCKASSSSMPTTMTIRMELKNAGVTGTTWAATSWSGTATMKVSATRKCTAGTVVTAVGSS